MGMPVNCYQKTRLSAEQVQTLYLEIQQRIGVLQVGAANKVAAQLAHISTTLYATKRDWIGYTDELNEDLMSG